MIFVSTRLRRFLRYIDRILPGPHLSPSDPRGAARMDQLMNVNDCYPFQGVGNVIGFQRVVGPKLMGLAPDEAAIGAAMPKAHVVFDALARELGDGLGTRRGDGSGELRRRGQQRSRIRMLG